MGPTRNSANAAGSSYSSLVGVVYVFNLIVGTGALAMPSAFSDAGYILSTVLVTLIALSSYMTVTLVIETMACANAYLKAERIDQQTSSASAVSVNTSADESQPLIVDHHVSFSSAQTAKEGHTNRWYAIVDRVELGEMVTMFYNRAGVVIFYICIVVYLYGDLAIYAVAVPNSLKSIFCTSNQTTMNRSVMCDPDVCWDSAPSISRKNAYRIYVALFFSTLGVFMFFDVQKTKVLQILTTLLRWTAFIIMIIIAVMQISARNTDSNPVSLPVGNFHALPSLFGVCVYSFMCHHSLPSLATPIRNKSRINSLFAFVYFFILLFYLLLSLTGSFAFSPVNALYTLNFDPADGQSLVANVPFLEYFISLFPVFTLSTNFPIIGITLRNNLKTLVRTVRQDAPEFHPIVDKLAFPFAVMIPPAIIAFVTDDVSFLVGITGSFPGAAIQYFVPITLAYLARRQMAERLGPAHRNAHASRFNNAIVAIPLLLWATVCVGFVVTNLITNPKEKSVCDL